MFEDAEEVCPTAAFGIGAIRKLKRIIIYLRLDVGFDNLNAQPWTRTRSSGTFCQQIPKYP